MPTPDQHFGRIETPEHTERYVSQLQYPEMRLNLPRMMRPMDRQPTYLWKPLLKCKPSWQRGQQQIGDCVSWGAEFAATLLLSQQAALGQMAWEAEAATETIYGGCRVEIARGEMGNDDGASGSWAAEWLNKFGVLLRKDYSKETGNSDHDMTEYSGRKAKSFGYYGNGGQNDEGKLDAIAKHYPVKEVTLVSTLDELVAALLHGCPVTCASSVGYEGNRNSDGIIPARGQWPHQMCYIGIDFTSGGEPLPICGNSWGESPVSGPFPGIEDDAIKLCAWRCRPQDAERQLSERDCFAFSRVEGFNLPPFNFVENLIV